MATRDDIENVNEVTHVVMKREFDDEYGKHSITRQHRKVLRNLALGMPKAKAWMSAFPKCRYTSNAYVCVKNLLAKKEAQQFLEDLRKEQDNFIDEENMITLDGVSQMLKESIADAQTLIDLGKETKDTELIIRGVQLKAKLAKDYSQVIGRGTYSKERKSNKSSGNNITIKDSEVVVSKLDELINGK